MLTVTDLKKGVAELTAWPTMYIKLGRPIKALKGSELADVVLEQLKQEAKRLGIRRLEGGDTHQPALDFLARHGFKPMENKKGWMYLELKW